MNLIYSFIGILPDYIIDSFYQSRIYFNGNIYLITDDINSLYINKLKNELNVIIINYNNLIENNSYINRLKLNFKKFNITENLNNRKLLFYRSFERLFLVDILIKKLNLIDNLSLEIDNLIYDNPNNWLNGFRLKSIAFMECDNHSHCSIGIIYIKNSLSLIEILNYMLNYIETNNDVFFSEMRAIYKYVFKFDNNKDFQLLPILVENTSSSFENSIFDPASYGVYLTGKDIIHTNNKLTLYLDSEDHIIKCSNYNYEWKNINGLKKPYIYDKKNNKWILINNLHIHSKRLDLGLSKPLFIL